MISAELIMLIIIVYLINTCILLKCFDAYDVEFLNPRYLYRRFRVNWFGLTVLTIVLNVLIAPVALCYWFYKLCTVGRK